MSRIIFLRFTIIIIFVIGLTFDIILLGNVTHSCDYSYEWLLVSEIIYYTSMVSPLWWGLNMKANSKINIVRIIIWLPTLIFALIHFPTCNNIYDFSFANNLILLHLIMSIITYSLVFI